MIEFVTLLLGLVAGPQTVSFAAAEGVAEVRLLVDGQAVAVDTSPPWSLALDLGSDLRPRLLEAVAYDGEGVELGRAAQRINIPRAPVELRIAFERPGAGAAGAASAALVTWESTVGAHPLRYRAWFDGAPLEVIAPARVALPAHDERSLHLFQIELEFTSDVIAKGQAVLGGQYLDELRTELTAIPVVPRGKGKKGRPEQMSGWFRVAEPGSADRPARVVALEKGGLDLVVVRAPGVGEAIQDLEGSELQGLSSPMGASGASMGATEGSGSLGVAAGPMAHRSTASGAERLRRIMALEGGQRLRLMAPRARTQAGRTVAMELFALSPEITPDQGGLYWALGQQVDLPGLAADLRLADAVAVAGVQAANGHRRRAVLLVLAGEAVDESRHSVAEVRDYLASVHVPLHVWRVGETVAGNWRDWGSGEKIADFRQLQSAARRLADQLDRQRIVWLEGRYLPNSIRVADRAAVAALD